MSEKSYKDFIVEVFRLHRPRDNDDETGIEDYTPDEIRRHFRHISTVNRTGHKIYDDGAGIIAALSPKDGRVDMGVHYQHMNVKKRLIRVDWLGGRRGSKLKAHQLYAHLIRRHGISLLSTHQTEGGRKVWQKLSKMKRVKVGTKKNIHGDLIPWSKLDPYKPSDMYNLGGIEYPVVAEPINVVSPDNKGKMRKRRKKVLR